MIAKKMFEELGYTLAYSDNLIIYHHESCLNSDTDFQRIVFDKNSKVFNTYRVEYNKGTHSIIHMGVLKAINQQCKELGWL